MLNRQVIQFLCLSEDKTSWSKHLRENANFSRQINNHERTATESH